jgi:hypothetical protein
MDIRQWLPNTGNPPDYSFIDLGEKCLPARSKKKVTISSLSGSPGLREHHCDSLACEGELSMAYLSEFGCPAKPASLTLA